MSAPEALKIQISLTEWLEKIGHSSARAMRDEDNEKRERLKVLKQHLGLPFDEPFQCLATDVVNNTPVFMAHVNAHGDELCAMRLIPFDPALPKLRSRGLTVRGTISQWFSAQKIDPTAYRVDFMPHPSFHLWSTIFVVNSAGVFGEIIVDTHSQLTQGFYSEHHPITFSFDFKEWKLSEDNPAALRELQETVAMLFVPYPTQTILREKLNAQFAKGYLCGYFETVNTTDFGRWFIDYNRILGDTYSLTPVVKKSADDGIRGQCGSPGKVTGRVRIVPLDEISETTLAPDEILVCDMTTPEYVPLMKQAAGIVTDRGGILSHAAIVSRELGKPCVVGTRNATMVLKDGDEIEVHAETGTCKKI